MLTPEEFDARKQRITTIFAALALELAEMEIIFATIMFDPEAQRTEGETTVGFAGNLPLASADILLEHYIDGRKDPESRVRLISNFAGRPGTIM